MRDILEGMVLPGTFPNSPGILVNKDYSWTFPYKKLVHFKKDFWKNVLYTFIRKFICKCESEDKFLTLQKSANSFS